MDINNNNSETLSQLSLISSSIKFEENGLWGLKSPQGEIILPAEYDTIEICADYIYVHYGERHKYFYYNGSTSDCKDRDNDYRFYVNGKLGLNNPNGTILIPAEYDEIIDWGQGCDVIYVREGKKFRYLNHKLEEILKTYKVIPEDDEPLYPYSISEDQSREVLLCIEPARKEFDNQTAFVFDQWCRLDRIPRSEIKDIFANCEIVPIRKSALDFFYSDFTYIYSARKAYSTNENPITTCVQKINSLGCYDSSWSYMLKITINHNTKIDNEDLYGAIKHYEDKYNTMRFDFAIGYDDTLAEDEVCVFMIYYYTEGEDDDEFLDEILSQDSLSRVKEAFLSHENKEHVICNAFKYLEYDEDREWSETEKVLNFMKSVGCNQYNALVRSSLWINPFYMEDVTPERWEFKKHIIEWALSNGANLNLFQREKTLYDNFIEDVQEAKEHSHDESKEFLESIDNAEHFAEWLRKNGALTKGETRDYMEKKLGEFTPAQLLDFVSWR